MKLLRILLVMVFMPLSVVACEGAVETRVKTDSITQDATTPATTTPAATTQEVFKYDGSRQCEKGSGTELAVMSEQLQAAGVDVLKARQGADGRMHPMVCGAGTGRINIFEINQQNVETAESLGFKRLQTP